MGALLFLTLFPPGTIPPLAPPTIEAAPVPSPLEAEVAKIVAEHERKLVVIRARYTRKTEEAWRRYGAYYPSVERDKELAAIGRALRADIAAAGEWRRNAVAEARHRHPQ